MKWLKRWAKSNAYKAKSDSKGNLIIKVPASKGFENAHSPDERLFIPSVEKVWEFLAALLESYGK